MNINLKNMKPGGGRYYRAQAFRWFIYTLIALPVIISLIIMYLNPFWFRQSFGEWICEAWEPVGAWILYRTWAIYIGCDPRLWAALNKVNN